MSEEEKSSVIWNAHIKELTTPGSEIYRAFEALENALVLASQANPNERTC